MKKRLLIISLTMAVMLDTAGQLLWKYAATRLPETSNLLHLVIAIFQQPYFLVLGAIFLCQLVNWLIVLEKADLSYAQPITSLSAIAVSILSVLLFGEHIGWVKATGIALVIAGVFFLSRGTAVSTNNKEALK